MKGARRAGTGRGNQAVAGRLEALETQTAGSRMTVARRCRTRWPAASLLASLATGLPAGQLDSATYFALDRGMSESEVLVRAGPPDLVTHPGGEVISRRSTASVVDEDGRFALLDERERLRGITIKEFHYIPDHTEHDPHLTIVTLRGGRVWKIERTKLLTRPRPPAGASTGGPPSRRPSDTEIRIERAERVRSAAEEYAATRERLKERAAAERERSAPAPAAPSPLHRGTGEDGVPYYGDTPPGGG